jgi:DNA replication initiation complex subunit (GINS family)
MQNKSMTSSISRAFEEETLEAKARWFQSLTDDERMEIFDSLTEMISENNPTIIEQSYVEQTTRRTIIISKSQFAVLDDCFI